MYLYTYVVSPPDSNTVFFDVYFELGRKTTTNFTEFYLAIVMITAGDVLWVVSILLWLISSGGLCYAIWHLRQELEAVVRGLSLLGREHEAHQRWTGILSKRLTHMDQVPRESTPSLFRMGGTLHSVPDPRRQHQSSSISLLSLIHI